MTSSYADNLKATKKSIDQLIERVDFNTIPPQRPELTPEHGNFTNPATGGTYKWQSQTSDLNVLGDTQEPLSKNCWVFYPHDTEITINRFDASLGNLWVDERDTFIVYVYNNGEIDDKPKGWYALTDKKRGYDNFVIQTAPEPSQLAIIDPHKSSEDITELLPGVILKQGFIYYNTTVNDLFIWDADTDDYGNPIDVGNKGEWIQITRQATTPSDADLGLKNSYEMLLERIDALEAAVASLP